MILVVASTFITKLYFLQVLNTEYELKAESNVKERIREQAKRGMIYDRNGHLIVANENVFDVMVIPRKFKLQDTVEFCRLFNIEKKELITQLRKASKGYKAFTPSPLIKQLSPTQFAIIQDKIGEYEGLDYEVRTIRRYVQPVLANVLGYVKEIDKKTLAIKKARGEDYEQRDLIGKAGIEASYDSVLRGEPGSRYVMMNVRRIEKGAYLDGKMDKPMKMGEDLQTSIDLQLQKYAEQLMQGKRGAVVAIEPATGEILTMVSGPSYHPNKLTGRGKEVTKNYLELLHDPDKPLFNRAAMAAYPPGSTIKTVQALVGLSMGVITENQQFSCIQRVVKCHGHPYTLNIARSIQYSCNPWYRQAYSKIILKGQRDTPENTRIGLQEWREYMHRFGLGHTAGTDIHGAKAGLIPDTTYYDRRFRNKKWVLSNIYSLSIGQGEMGATPLQMANVAATIANRGYYIAPHIVRKIGGDSTRIHPRFRTKQHTGIAKKWFDLVIEGMENVPRAGTARRAYIKDIVVCGKTGTAQNPHGEDHSVFIAFAPKENPKIAVAAYIENAGFGGTWAAPISSLIIEKYLRENGEITRKYAEKRILEKRFIKPKQKKEENKPNEKEPEKTEDKPQQQKPKKPKRMAENQTIEPKVEEPKIETAQEPKEEPKSNR